MKHCGIQMTEWRSRQYNETNYECVACRYFVAIDDNGSLEIIREGL